MIKFKPIGYNQTYDSRNNTTLVKSINLGRIYSPYVGVVNNTSSNDCEGYIELKHEIDDVTYYSLYCNVDKVIVSRGDKVRPGDIIGYTKEKESEVLYTLINDNNKVNPSSFFRNNKFIKLNDDDDKDSKEEKSKKSDKSPKKSKDKTPKNVTRSNSPSGSLLSSIVLSPLDFVGKNLEKGIDTVKDEFKNLKSVKSKKKNDEESLNEEIKRIKKLL